MPNEEIINGFRVCLLAALQKYYEVKDSHTAACVRAVHRRPAPPSGFHGRLFIFRYVRLFYFPLRQSNEACLTHKGLEREPGELVRSE